MNSRQRLLLWGTVPAVPFGFALLVGLIVLNFWLSLRPVPLEAWVQRVRRPGYRLLYSTETPLHSYYAIFDAGNEYLALCELDRMAHGTSGWVGSTDIRSADGQDALDNTDNRPTVPLLRNLLGIWTVDDGVALPIKPALVGKLHIQHELDGANVLDVEIEWGRQ
jgi:hypothetical protein